MGWKRSSLRHEGGDVLKLGVRFPSGKWQSVKARGMYFGFQFRFGLLLGYVVYWYRVRAKLLRVIALVWYVVGWLYVCGRGVISF
jgi:hypothetical protein